MFIVNNNIFLLIVFPRTNLLAFRTDIIGLSDGYKLSDYPIYFDREIGSLRPSLPQTQTRSTYSNSLLTRTGLSSDLHYVQTILSGQLPVSSCEVTLPVFGFFLLASP